LAHGIDERRVVPDHEAKSISHETTFAVDIEDAEVLRSWLMQQTEQVARRLRRHGLRGRTVQLKLRYADFTTITRSLTLKQATDLTEEIWQAAAELLASRLPPRRLSVRLLGVGVSGIERASEAQQSLFADEERERHARLDSVTDQIRNRFGNGAVNRAIGLRNEERGD
jgi:DNA polymerase-4